MKNIYDSSHNYTVIDIYNKRKYEVKKYLNFLMEYNEETFHLGEKPLYPSPVLVDVDIKKPYNGNLEELYNEATILSIINSYVKILNKFLQNKPSEYKVLLLQKPPKISDNFIKHGFHLHFPSISLGKEDLKFLYEKVREDSEYSELLDDPSSKPWLLYGASKSPESEPYKITKGYIVKNDIDNDDFDINSCDNYLDMFIGEKIRDIEITEKNVRKMIRAIMSIRCVNNFTMQKINKMNRNLTRQMENLQINDFSDNSDFESDDEDFNESTDIDNDLEDDSGYAEINIKHTNITNTKIGDLVSSLKDSRAEDYNDWVKIAMILTSLAKARGQNKNTNGKTENETINFFRGIFHLFSRKSRKYNEHACEAKWDHFMKTNYTGGLGIGTLIYMAKQDGVNVDTINFNFCIEKIPINDYDIAIMVKEFIPEMFITHKEHGCYKFDSTVWKSLTGWDNIFKKYVTNWFIIYSSRMKKDISEIEDEKERTMYAKLLAKLDKKIKNYSSLNNIVKSLFDLYFDESIDELFVQKDTMIAFKNCVFDHSNWKIVQPDPRHLFSNRIEHDLLDWDDDVPEDKKAFVLDFLEKIFPNPELRNYWVKNFARVFTGKNSFKQFQFWTGDGNNGKSVCITLMEYILGKMAMKTPKSLVTGAVHKQGAVNPELFRLKDARLAIIDEVTENDFLDPGQIKGLTGNDKLYGRDLYQRSKDISEITPMFFPILITNDVPIIKKPDDATWNRIRLINFESTFVHNVEQYKRDHPYKTENIYKIDPRMNEKLKKNAQYFCAYFMSILFEYDSFEEFNYEEVIPDKVKEGLEKFKEGQNILRKFIDENFMVDKDSTEVFSFNKLMKEYNSSRVKVPLNLEEVKTALRAYANIHPELTITETSIKGMKRVDF